jgi:hypothetical protein
MDIRSYLRSLMSPVEPPPKIDFSLPPDTPLEKRKQIAKKEASEYNEKDFAKYLQSWVDDQKSREGGSMNANPPTYLPPDLEQRMDSHTLYYNWVVHGVNMKDKAVSEGRLKGPESDKLDSLIDPHIYRLNAEGLKLKTDILKHIQGQIKKLNKDENI